MNNRVWWVAALQGVIWFIAMTVVTRWVARSRIAPAGHDPNLLRYPTTVLVIGLVCTVLFAATAVVCFLTSPASPFLIAVIVFPLVAGGVYLVVDYFMARFYVEPAGIRFRTPLQGRGQIEWKQIQQIGWSQSLKWFIVKTTDRRTVRLPATLIGLPVLARAALSNVSADRFTPIAASLFRQTADGNPPSPWN